jgi:hypothetical protein
MNPWPPENIEKIRADAAAGLSVHQCAIKRRFNPATIRKHARLNDIVFATEPRRDRFSVEDQRDIAWAAAKDNLQREIQAAKAEAAHTPLWRWELPA